ncbi:poly-gamma-glutamate hydrolase family protein [Staphylococcus massiliensis]|uniref:poly-gamma-glutamate hydrolase family protein n=1 Tax=Staphylococcus massiliensis TaxID=555791 RepID=UPI001EE0064F|nr:poly-gamma-glutamate hydrolase family protein [Staphylococcus massiliensis]MCG3402249.1 poly-gamma-glutamate hydrolase family protein [Staphylococcus massiliensis]
MNTKRLVGRITGLCAVGVLSMSLMMPHGTAHAEDTYDSMTDLMTETTKGEDWVIETLNEGRKSLVMAPHGGGIEPGTSEVAKRIASNTISSYYTFKGMRASDNSELHVTSSHFDEPKALEMVKASNKTVSIHKTKQSEYDVYIGGLDKDLQAKIKDELEAQGFRVAAGTDGIAGTNPDNIVNRNQKGAGVQLDLSSDTVKTFFKDGDLSRSARSNAQNYTEEMDKFVQAVDRGITQ